MRPTAGTAPEAVSASAFPWDEALALGLGRVAWAPHDFWNATPRELMAAAGLTPRRALDRAGLDRLLAAFPDER